MANAAKRPRPTDAVYDGLSAAYDHFNKVLFDGELPHCLITMRSIASSYGYFCGDRFVRAHGSADEATVDEIAINPQHVAERSPEAVLATLAHEMAHQWQHRFGKPPTRCYHDKEWAKKMKEIGLYPSSTGEIGGKETGPKVSHYIIEGGPFAKACATFLKDNTPALYQDVVVSMAAMRRKLGRVKPGSGSEEEGSEAEAEKSPGRLKFQCKGCGLNAWAKPGAKLGCIECKGLPMSPAEPKEKADAA